ncbi:TetR/AcrR family transcriptional regulator [Streptomyces sp. NPDC057966]|uniref:TetR/AcrR family transcriptional regulator n=1 Tax=Streptomyces sp. NPDC057966 TaxID=3346292 RepID=UPI0036E91C83
MNTTNRSSTTASVYAATVMAGLLVSAGFTPDEFMGRLHGSGGFTGCGLTGPFASTASNESETSRLIGRFASVARTPGMTTRTRRARERAEREQREQKQWEQLIVTAARKLAESEGWSAVTTRRLASEVEYGRPVLYSHFKDRDAIMAAVTVEGCGVPAAALRTARTPATEERGAPRRGRARLVDRVGSSAGSSQPGQVVDRVRSSADSGRQDSARRPGQLVKARPVGGVGPSGIRSSRAWSWPVVQADASSGRRRPGTDQSHRPAHPQVAADQEPTGRTGRHILRSSRAWS